VFTVAEAPSDLIPDLPFASIESRELRVLLDRVFWPVERRSAMEIGGGPMRRDQLMEPDFFSELLVLVIAAVIQSELLICR
jgi:hypothetical protein